MCIYPSILHVYLSIYTPNIAFSGCALLFGRGVFFFSPITSRSFPTPKPLPKSPIFSWALGSMMPPASQEGYGIQNTGLTGRCISKHGTWNLQFMSLGTLVNSSRPALSMVPSISSFVIRRNSLMLDRSRFTIVNQSLSSESSGSSGS